MFEIPRVSYENKLPNKGWWFEYGRWDLRAYCPACGYREFFLGLSVAMSNITDDGIITHSDVWCRGCGCSGPFRLLGFNQEALDIADAKERRFTTIGGKEVDSLKPEDWHNIAISEEVYNRKLELDSV